MVLYTPKSQTPGGEEHSSGSCECGEEIIWSDSSGWTLSQESATKEKRITRQGQFLADVTLVGIVYA